MWVTDITHIGTDEGLLFLAAIVRLYSRQVIGRGTQYQTTTDLELQALESAMWKRKPVACLIIHSDQGNQFTSSDWQSLLKQHAMVSCMSRRGHCHDNAVAQSSLSSMKRERIKRRTPTGTMHADVFNHVEMFYNPVRRDGSAGDLASVEFERR